MKPKERGVISNYINANDAIARQLIELGIIPGLPITLEQKFPFIAISFGDRKIEIPKELARSVNVRMA